MTRLLIHVQYLKGIGHLKRIGLVAQAAAATGLDVHVASGGLPIPGFPPAGTTLHQLAPLQAGPSGFSDLQDGDGVPIDDAWRSARRDRLLALFGDLEPDQLLIETFPFGRRALSFELAPLLEAAAARAPKPIVLCSIRDILQRNRKPGRAEETMERLRTWFDGILVHGDERFARLEESFAPAREITQTLYHTGFVASPAADYAPTAQTPREEVIVSAGGGAVGPALLNAAIEARPETALRGACWRLLAGPNLPETDFAALKTKAGDGIILERFRDDFPRLLGSAALSISYAGYNTVCDLMQARCRAVLISFGGKDGHETEQADRAARLQERGFGIALPDSELTPERLAQAIGEALEMDPAGTPAFDMDGATRSAERLRGWTV